MKFAVSIYKNEDISYLKDVGDSFILYIPKMSCVYDLDFDLGSALRELDGKEVILGINKVYLEWELDDLRNFVKKHSSYKMLVSDLGAVEILKEEGLLANAIYDPNTLICNSMELELFSRYGFTAVGMSSEIPLADVQTAFRRTNAHIFYQVFGRKIMFYSKRKLVDIYKEFSHLDFGHEKLELQEYMREEKYPLFYNEGGTYVYRDYLISLLKEMKNLSFLEYAYIEGITLNPEITAKVVSIFKKAAIIDDISECESELSSLELNIQNGFTYKDTAYVKEGFDGKN